MYETTGQANEPAVQHFDHLPTTRDKHPWLKRTGAAGITTYFNIAVFDHLRPVTKVLTYFFGFVAFSHFFFLPRFALLPMVLLAGSSAFVCAACSWLLPRVKLSPRAAHPLATLLVGIMLVNSVTQLLLLRDPLQSTNIAFLIIAAGGLLLSLRWMMVIILVASGAWAAIAVMLATPATNSAWAHFGYAILMAIFAALVLQATRKSVYARMARLHAGDQERQRALETAMQAVQQSEERTRRLSAATFEGIVIHDRGMIVDANDALADMIGIPLATVRGMDFRQLFAPDNSAPILHNVQLDEQGCWEAHLRCQDGSIFPVEVRARSIHHEHGYLQVVAVRDITERLEAQARLQQERDFTAAILDTAGCLVLVLDLQGRIVSFNRTCEQLTGFVEAEVVGRFMWDLFLPPNEVDGVKHTVDEICAGQYPNSHENYWRTRSGAASLIAWSNTAIVDALGNTLYIIATGIDITERHAAQQELRRQKEYFAALHATTLALMNRLDINDLLETIMRRAAQLLNTTHGAVYLVDAANDAIELRVGMGLCANAVGIRQSRGEGVIGIVWETGQSIINNDYANWPGRSLRWKSEVIAALAAVPLKSGQHVVGALSLLYTDAGAAFSADAIGLLEGFAQLASLALDNARLYTEAQQELAERTRTEAALRLSEARTEAGNRHLSASLSELEQHTLELALLNDLSGALHACKTLDDAYRAVATRMPMIVPQTSGAVFVQQPQAGRLHQVARWGGSSAPQSLTTDACCAMQHGRAYRFSAATTQKPCSHVDPAIAPQALCLPLEGNGESYGMMHVNALHEFNESTINLAATVASTLGLVIANLQLQARLRSEAIRDPLTQLFNRRYMEESLERERQRVDRKGLGISIIMLDIDHFKQFNDTWGHEAGDMLLRAVASVLQTQTRRGDIVCRYGGEEFAIIMPDAALPVAEARAEALRQAVEAVDVLYEGQRLGRVTVSVGVANYAAQGGDMSSMIREADGALYAAKRAGRNRVAVAHKAVVVE